MTKRMSQAVLGVFGFIMLAVLTCAALGGCGVRQAEPADDEAAQIEEQGPAEDSTSKDEQSALHEVVIPERVVNMSGYDAQGLADDLVGAGSVHLGEVRASEGTVVVQLGEDDVAWWQERTDALLADVAARFAELEEGCQMSFSPAYDRIDLTFPRGTDVQRANELATGAEYWCAMRQLLSGDGDGAWSVEMAVYNSATGNLVAEGRYGSDVLGEGLEYDDSDWERSEEQ